MFPPGHLGGAYILYSLVTRSRLGETPTAGPTAVVLVASLFPDLVDKPLAWYLGVLPTGRTLAHSLLFLVPLSLFLYWLARRRGRPELGVAFAVGALSHSFLDALPALGGEPVDAYFLLWPLLPVEEYDDDVSTSVLERLYEAFLANPELASAYFLLEFLLLGAAIWLWRRDGYPGLEALKRFSEQSKGQ